MNCPIREHTGDGAYVGRCEFYSPDGVCPRHGYIVDYPNQDDRDVAIEARRFPRDRYAERSMASSAASSRSSRLAMTEVIVIFSVAAVLWAALLIFGGVWAFAGLGGAIIGVMIGIAISSIFERLVD